MSHSIEPSRVTILIHTGEQKIKIKKPIDLFKKLFTPFESINPMGDNIQRPKSNNLAVQQGQILQLYYKPVLHSKLVFLPSHAVPVTDIDKEFFKFRNSVHYRDVRYNRYFTRCPYQQPTGYISKFPPLRCKSYWLTFEIRFAQTPIFAMSSIAAQSYRGGNNDRPSTCTMNSGVWNSLKIQQG